MSGFSQDLRYAARRLRTSKDVRYAVLGAGRAPIVRQLLTESVGSLAATSDEW